VRRREFITLLGGAVAAWPLAARAQQAERMRRIGVLYGGGGADDPDAQANIAAFLHALQQLGWTDGRNVKIEYRRPLGDADNTRKYAAELAALAPDVILSSYLNFATAPLDVNGHCSYELARGVRNT
jgi:putative tryptophan/tyrosine transport system substrate-binding protein